MISSVLLDWPRFDELWLPIGSKVIIAIICGGLVGLEREIKHKPAGLRTNILICLGATLYTILSNLIIQETVAKGINADPGRIAAQIVTGIGFLGGGMIIQSRGSVTGLTSAATVWVVAAIGLCVCIGYPLIALLFTATVFFTLHFLSYVDQKILGKSRVYRTRITTAKDDGVGRELILKAFHYVDLTLSNLQIKEVDGFCVIDVIYVCSEERHLRVNAAMWGVPSVKNVEVEIT